MPRSAASASEFAATRCQGALFRVFCLVGFGLCRARRRPGTRGVGALDSLDHKSAFGYESSECAYRGPDRSKDSTGEADDKRNLEECDSRCVTKRDPPDVPLVKKFLD